MKRITTALLCLLCAHGLAQTTPKAPSPTVRAIVIPTRPTFGEAFAASEIRRYLYIRTGALLPITRQNAVLTSPAIAVARAQTSLAQSLGAQPLQPQEYWLQSVTRPSKSVALIAGGDDAAVLYGAYRFVEYFGVRFGLEGDTIPDGRVLALLPELNDHGKPLFNLRGIQPFHDFAEGPDWWNLDDYKAIIAQLPKLGMNFIGLHTYPEPIAEPTVWIGPVREVERDGSVKAAYPASYQNTIRGDWGYQAKKTSDFVYGASSLFDQDAYGAEVMRGQMPKPATPDGCAAVFNRTAQMLRESFQFAHQLSISTCVGTETPLTIPAQVQARLRASGKNPADPRIVREVYAGMFKRIAAAYPIDYYWLWTPEGWTWSGTTPQQEQSTTQDIEAALGALQDSRAPFTLATCGWVLGPPSDRAAFDRLLPKNCPVSCINRQVGNEPVEQGFAKITGRPKWAIPWLEDDPGLTEPQLWAGRMRQDAFDALRYGCTGLMGIHWRTRILSPNIMALARAAWNQDGFAKPLQPDGPVGGSVALFPGAAVANTQHPELYRSVRYNMSAYNFTVPNGSYTVILRFCEPHYEKPGVRVFDVALQGKTVIEALDLFATVGKNRALDYTFRDVAVTNGKLVISFPPRVEYPCIAAIEVIGAKATRRINCGGQAYSDFAADPISAPRGLPVEDLYRSWARAQFGGEVSRQAGAIFTKLDGNYPRPLEWTDGPGGLTPDGRSWEESQKDFAFIAQFEALEPQVKGKANHERYMWWLHQFEYIRDVAHLRCQWAAFNRAMAQIKLAQNATDRATVAQQSALPARIELVTCLKQVYTHLLATVGNTGELGTLANWEQHILPGLLDGPGVELAEALSKPLPPEAMPAMQYAGPLRVFAPTARTSLQPSEPLRLRAIVLSHDPIASVVLQWRRFGAKRYTPVTMSPLARGVYRADLPAAAVNDGDIEYYIVATATTGANAVWPVTAPALGQTVVRMPSLTRRPSLNVR